MSKYSLDQFNYSLKTNSWDRVPRDPVSTVGYALFGGGGFTVLTASQMLISQIIFYAGATLVAGYLLRALTPKIERGSELLANIKDPAAPREIVYGEVRKGGTVTHLESTDDNQYLHMFIALAGHEIESVEKIYINDEDHTSNWTRSTGIITGTTDTEKDWSGKVRVFSHLGAQTSATDTFEDSTETLSSTYHTETELAAVNSNFIGKGVAYLYVRLDYDADVFEDGIPTVTAVVRGKKVQNENGVAQTYPASANAAYVIRDYLINEYGVDDDSANIDTSAFSTAATVCDTSSGSGASNKFLVNGVLSTGNSRIENLEQLTATCGGALFWSAGQWVLKAAAFTSSVKTLDLTDLRSKVQINTKHSGRDNFNTVRGTFNDQDQDWIEVDYPQVTSSTYLTEDNDQRSVLDLSFPLVTVSAQAQRLAKLTLNRHREQLTMTANFGLNAFNLEVGDVIKFNDYNSETEAYRYGFFSPVEKTWEVIGWRFAPVENNDLQVQLTLRETSSTAFDWDADEEAIVSNNTSLPSVYTGLTVSNVSVTDKGNTQEDGTFVGQAEVSWTQAANKFVNHYEIQYKDVNESSYITTTVPSSESSVIITSLEVGTQYNIRVRAVTATDQKGSWVSPTPYTHGGDNTAPSPVTGLSATGGPKIVTLDWTAPTTNSDTTTLYDLKGYNIYRATTNSQPASPIAFSGSDKYVDGGLGVNTQYYYWVTALDFTGNESTAVASGAVTTDSQASGVDTDTRIYSGRLYWQTLQASAPSGSDVPSASNFTFSVSSEVFTTRQTGWNHSQTSVANTSLAVKEWSVPYTVTVDADDNVDSISFGTIAGAFQITDTIESDNFNSTDGWQINKDGTATFNAAVIRGTLNVGQVPNLTSAKITDLGGLATQNTVSATTDIIGLGALALKNNVSASTEVTGLATVATSGSASDVSGLSTVATSGNASDVIGLGTLATKNSVSASTEVTGLATVATSGSASDVSGLSTVATTGSYNDLSSTPDLSSYATTVQLNNKSTIIYSSSTPSSTSSNDLWYKTTEDRYYRYNGSSWVPVAITADSIVATYIYAGDVNASQINAGTINAARIPTLSTAKFDVMSGDTYGSGKGRDTSAITGTCATVSFTPTAASNCVVLVNAALNFPTAATDSSYSYTFRLYVNNVQQGTSYGFGQGDGGSATNTLTMAHGFSASANTSYTMKVEFTESYGRAKAISCNQGALTAIFTQTQGVNMYTDFDWDMLRDMRNRQLQSSDRRMLWDSNLTDEQKQEWATYRQALRDLPANTTNPLEPNWPEAPE